jgi:hypothetical protein
MLEVIYATVFIFAEDIVHYPTISGLTGLDLLF